MTAEQPATAPQLLEEIQTRLRRMFADLAAGLDVAPALRLRTEGMMEAALLAGLAEAAGLDDLQQQCYLAAFGRSMEQDFGEDWRDFYPFPQIPAVGRRAPVYPSTRE